jgi:hypothetical protein
LREQVLYGAASIAGVAVPNAFWKVDGGRPSLVIVQRAEHILVAVGAEGALDDVRF